MATPDPVPRLEVAETPVPEEPAAEDPETKEPAAPEPAWIVVTLAKPGYADVFVDGERVGQTPRGGTRFETVSGHHELLLSNPAGKDYKREFDVEPGATAEFKSVLLQRKAVRVAFRETLEDACTVRQDGQELGTLSAVGRVRVIDDSDRQHLLEIRCPSGFTEDLNIGPKQAGALVYVGPAP